MNAGTEPSDAYRNRIHSRGSSAVRLTSASKPRATRPADLAGRVFCACPAVRMTVLPHHSPENTEDTEDKPAKRSIHAGLRLVGH